MLAFTVIDTGPGLAPAIQAKIFEAFAQGDATVRRQSGGTGLGLTISRQLARFLGGDIEIESTEGCGSSFKLSIDPGPLDNVPLVSDFADDPETSSTLEDLSTHSFLKQVREDCRSERILLVEDGSDNRRLISYMLEKVGFRVSHAEHGAEGVEQALAAREAGEPFDLVLMDMQMPVLDGYAATRALRGEGFGLPIVALTAHAMKGERERCLEAGCDEYATKPIDRRNLVRTILRLVGAAKPEA